MKKLIKICTECGDVFNTKYPQQKCCGDECKKIRMNRIRRERYKFDSSRYKLYYVKNKERIKKYQLDRYYQKQKELQEYQLNYFQNNKERYKINQKNYRLRHPERRRVERARYALNIIKKNPKLTIENRRLWGRAIRFDETNNSKYNYCDGFHSHHIFPLRLYPFFGLELWNGVPLSEKWHNDFHIKYGKVRNGKGYEIDWPGLLFDFIEDKIRESNRDLVTLDQWIRVEA